MNKRKKILLISFAAVIAIIILGYIPIWKNDMEARENRRQIYALVQVGDDLKSAERKIEDAGFRLRYEEAIAPTISKDYLQQLVVIGDTRPNFFETLGYTLQVPWMPFVHSESPYVIIEATLEGEIIRLQ